MKYENIAEAIFLNRPNRFVAEIEIKGRAELAHVKNTGRCKELLIRGAAIYVRADKNPNRKTKYDLISVYKGSRLVNIDSQIPNQVFREWVEKSGHFGEITLIRPEQRYRNSRFDFYMEAGGRKTFVEVKGVTLEENGVAMFPDAPTERGVKHVEELISAVTEGYRAAVVFIIQMKGIEYFVPNDKMHQAFGHALREAAAVTSAVTHNHPEGVRGAKATAACIFWARQGMPIAGIRGACEERYGYDLKQTLDEIRPHYKFNESCQETVPQAIIAFLESHDFEDAIRNAISLGGDSDTLAAITGSIAEAYYGIPDHIRQTALSYLDDDLRVVWNDWLGFTAGK